MKRLAFLTAAFAALFLVSCDNIEEPDTTGKNSDGGGSTGTPTGIVKHPYVKPEDRVSSVVRDYGDKKRKVYTFEYDENGEMSSMVVYEDVKSNSCAVVDVYTYDFKRTGNSIQFSYRGTSPEYVYEPDEKGCIDVGDGKLVKADRVWAYDWLCRQVPPKGYEDWSDDFFCEWTGKDMIFKYPTEEWEGSFTFDEDGNLLSQYESDVHNVWIAGDLKKTTCASYYVYSEGREDTFTYSDDENVFCGVSIMSLLQCSYEYESWSPCGDEYMNDLIYGLHTRHLPVRHQLKYTLDGEEHSEIDVITYERDGQGRITKVISTPAENQRGGSQTFPETYTLSYAEPFPSIARVEPELEPGIALDNQKLETVRHINVYDDVFNSVNYGYHAHVVSTYRDGHEEDSDEHYYFGEVSFSVKACGLSMEDPRPLHGSSYGWLVSMDEYKALKKRPVISDEGFQKYVDSGVTEYQKLFKLDYGTIHFFALICWEEHSSEPKYDYLPLWNGSSFEFISTAELTEEYAQKYNPDKLTLTVAGDWEQTNTFEQGDGMTQFTFEQPLRLSLPDGTVLCEYTASDYVCVK